MLRRSLTVASIALALAGCSARAGVDIQASTVVPLESRAADEGKIWVCHRGRWQEVGEPAAAGHSRHGDALSEARRSSGSSC